MDAEHVEIPSQLRLSGSALLRGGSRADRLQIPQDLLALMLDQEVKRTAQGNLWIAHPIFNRQRRRIGYEPVVQQRLNPLLVSAWVDLCSAQQMLL